jgi:hypothetical protein
VNSSGFRGKPGRSQPGAVQRFRQFNAWLERGFNPVYASVLLAAGATFFALVLGIPGSGSWAHWYFVWFFISFGIVSLVRVLRARRRRWAVRFANGHITPLRSETKAREMSGGASWGHPVLLHRESATADWAEQP